MEFYDLRQRFLRRAARRRRQRELQKICRLPARTSGRSALAGPDLAFIDGPSFASAFEAIFEHHIYRFVPTGSPPRVVDCGANVGLGIVYWKSAFPDCVITAFEPDASAFGALTTNCAGYDDVELVKAAVWTRDGEAAFVPDGADAGRLQAGGGAAAVEVPTVRLRDRLPRALDLLKLDIEGAEVAVLEDCADRLDGVENLFVEYHSFASRPQDLEVLLGTISGSGFRWHIQAEYAASTPFLATPLDRGMDQRLNVFAYRRQPAGG